MVKMTSAYANKMLRRLKEDKEFWVNKERESYLYVAAVGEEPVIPDYDFTKVADTIAKIDEKIIAIKHAINVSNILSKVQVGETEMTVDAILIKMAQLNKRKATLDNMRKQQPKSRVDSRFYMAGKNAPEYQYINYDLELVKGEYERIDAEIAAMQMALDKFNQTYAFEVEID